MGNVRHSHHRELDEKILLMVFSYKGGINKFKSMKPVYLFSFISVRCSEFSVLCILHITHSYVGVNPANSPCIRLHLLVLNSNFPWRAAMISVNKTKFTVHKTKR